MRGHFVLEVADCGGSVGKSQVQLWVQSGRLLLVIEIYGFFRAPPRGSAAEVVVIPGRAIQLPQVDIVPRQILRIHRDRTHVFFAVDFTVSLICVLNFEFFHESCTFIFTLNN